MSMSVVKIGQALNHGLEYFGHELDDVAAEIHAISPEAKMYEDALLSLDKLRAELHRAWHAESRHNHLTRDIKKWGECPSCDRYHRRCQLLHLESDCVQAEADAAGPLPEDLPEEEHEQYRWFQKGFHHGLDHALVVLNGEDAGHEG